MNHIAFPFARSWNSKIPVEQKKPCHWKLTNFIDRTMGCWGILLLADQLGCPRPVSNIATLAASSLSVGKAFEDNWQSAVETLEGLVENEFVDVSYGRFLIVQAIAVGLAFEANVSTTIAVKVIKNDGRLTRFVHDAAAGPCSLEKPWIAVTEKFLQTRSLKKICFVLSREIGHIKYQRSKKTWTNILVPIITIFDPIGLCLFSRPMWVIARLSGLVVGGIVSSWLRLRAEAAALRHAKWQCGMGPDPQRVEGGDAAKIFSACDTFLLAEMAEELFSDEELDLEAVLGMMAGTGRSCWRRLLEGPTETDQSEEGMEGPTGGLQ